MVDLKFEPMYSTNKVSKTYGYTDYIQGIVKIDLGLTHTDIIHKVDDIIKQCTFSDYIGLYKGFARYGKYDPYPNVQFTSNDDMPLNTWTADHSNLQGVYQFYMPQQVITANSLNPTSVKCSRFDLQLIINHTNSPGFDINNNQYEYKISKASNWNFQDISENVLNKYNNIKYFILAIKNISDISISKIYLVKVKELLQKIRVKLQEKKKEKKVFFEDYKYLSHYLILKT